MLTTQHLEVAGFVRLGAEDEDPVLAQYLPRYFHASVLDMPALIQRNQPWIECRLANVWSRMLSGRDQDEMEGRCGALRHPMNTEQDLQQFMALYGYTSPLRQLTGP